MHSKYRHYSELIHRRAVIRLVILGLLLYIVVLGSTGLRQSIQAVRSADMGLLGLALLAVFASYVTVALTYVLLAQKRIPFLPTLLIQCSSGLVNRLLPAGLGGLGINAWYLKKRGHTLSASITIVATNNALGFVGTVMLILAVIVLHPHYIFSVKAPDFPTYTSVGLIIVITIAAILLKRSHRIAFKLGRSIGEVKTYFMLLSRRPGRAFGALCSSILLTSLHAAALFAVLIACNIDIVWPVALFAIAIGAFSGAAVPTPGGIGGAEAGIAATLVSFGVPFSSALTGALIYRGLTYWLPLAPGYVALRLAEKRYL